MQQVICLKCAVFKMQQSFQISRLMLCYKLMRRIVHQLHQLFAFGNNGGAIAPCKYGRKKSGNFNVLLLGKSMRNAYRIGCNKSRLIVLLYFIVEKLDKRSGLLHLSKIGSRC